MVVKQCGTAGLDAVDEGGICAVFGALQGEAAVDGPPHAVQYLVEIGGVVSLYGQAPCKGGINMGMDIDEGRHYHHALGIHKLRIGILCLKGSGFAQLYYFGTLYGHAAVFYIGHCGVSCDNFSVSDKIHIQPPYNDDVIFVV